MNKLSLRQKIAFIIFILGMLAILIFRQGLYSKVKKSADTSSDPAPVIVSITPNLRQEPILLPTQTIEVTFNLPLENAPETRIKFDPELDYKIDLSEDRKTVKISPKTTYQLGQGYTLFILNETKFENKKQLGETTQYNFKTINYRGV